MGMACYVWIGLRSDTEVARYNLVGDYQHFEGMYRRYLHCFILHWKWRQSVPSKRSIWDRQAGSFQIINFRENLGSQNYNEIITEAFTQFPVEIKFEGLLSPCVIRLGHLACRVCSTMSRRMFNVKRVALEGRVGIANWQVMQQRVSFKSCLLAKRNNVYLYSEHEISDVYRSLMWVRVWYWSYECLH
jgi:hypothetical protein